MSLHHRNTHLIGEAVPHAKGQRPTAPVDTTAFIVQRRRIKLDSVASDVLGASGQMMLKALVAGERTPSCWPRWPSDGCGPRSELRLAPRGRFSDHHALLTGVLMDHLEHLEAAIAHNDERPDELMVRLARPATAWTRSPV